MTTTEQRRIAEFEREMRELRRANENLEAASAFFASGSSTRSNSGGQHCYIEWRTWESVCCGSGVVFRLIPAIGRLAETDIVFASAP
jgi:hypothetical protein